MVHCILYISLDGKLSTRIYETTNQPSEFVLCQIGIDGGSESNPSAALSTITSAHAGHKTRMPCACGMGRQSACVPIDGVEVEVVWTPQAKQAKRQATAAREALVGAGRRRHWVRV